MLAFGVEELAFVAEVAVGVQFFDFLEEEVLEEFFLLDCGGCHAFFADFYLTESDHVDFFVSLQSFTHFQNLLMSFEEKLITQMLTPLKLLLQILNPELLHHQHLKFEVVNLIDLVFNHFGFFQVEFDHQFLDPSETLLLLEVFIEVGVHQLVILVEVESHALGEVEF